jgi:hypothetical protein
MQTLFFGQIMQTFFFFAYIIITMPMKLLLIFSHKLNDINQNIESKGSN